MPPGHKHTRDSNIKLEWSKMNLFLFVEEFEESFPDTYKDSILNSHKKSLAGYKTVQKGTWPSCARHVH